MPGCKGEKVIEFTTLNRVGINCIYNKLRAQIAKLCKAGSPFVNEEVKLDECFFGAHRMRGFRGRGMKRETPVFEMLKRGDKSIFRL